MDSGTEWSLDDIATKTADDQQDEAIRDLARRLAVFRDALTAHGFTGIQQWRLVRLFAEGIIGVVTDTEEDE